MVKSKQLVAEYRLQIGRYSYEQMDCIGSIANIIYRHGGAAAVTGSNWWARHEIVNLRPLTNKSQLYDGCAVLKTVLPGQPGYKLPERYRGDVDQIDYNHIGLGTDAGDILDSTRTASGRDGPGISTAPISSSSWDVIGDFMDVDYSDRHMPAAESEINGKTQEVNMPMQKAVVIAEHGSTVNLRSRRSTIKSVILQYVPVGSTVSVGELQDGWYKVSTASGKTGWMKQEFLRIESAEGNMPEVPDTSQSVPVGDTSQAIAAAKQCLLRAMECLDKALDAL